jgi:hypothetical protein
MKARWGSSRRSYFGIRPSTAIEQWATRPNDLLPALADPFTWLGMAWMLAPQVWAIILIARIHPVLAAAVRAAGGAALFAAVNAGLLLT